MFELGADSLVGLTRQDVIVSRYIRNKTYVPQSKKLTTATQMSRGVGSGCSGRKCWEKMFRDGVIRAKTLGE